MGKVVLVGAGPGDPGLLTIKGKEYIEKADVIIYDRLIPKEILLYAKDGCELIYAGKEDRHHTLPQNEINDLLYRKALERSLVVRLKGGDPFVFGRGGEEALFLMERGINVQVVPGVSSCIAVPSYAGIPITHRGLSKGFHVVRAHIPEEIDFKGMTDPMITYVFLMGLSHINEIMDGLINAGRDPFTPVAVISEGTTNEQKKYIGCLKDMGELAEKERIVSPAIIVVGDVVTLSNEICGSD